MFFWAILLVLAWVVWAAFERPMRARILALWPNRDPKAIAKQLARAYETPKQGSGWSLLLAPNNKSLLAGVMGLTLLLTPVALAMKYPPPQTAAPAEMASIIAATPADIRDARFGDTLELLGVRFIPGTDSVAPQVKLVCRALNVVSGDISVGIHFVDSQGNILGQADVVEDADHFAHEEPWIETVMVPPQKTVNASALGITVYGRGKPVEPIDRGTRDWDFHRLLIPLPRDDK